MASKKYDIYEQKHNQIAPSKLPTIKKKVPTSLTEPEKKIT